MKTTSSPAGEARQPANGRGPHSVPSDDQATQPTCGLPGADPLQRCAVTVALALVAALIAASQVGCGGSADPLPDEPRTARPAEPAASQAI